MSLHTQYMSLVLLILDDVGSEVMDGSENLKELSLQSSL